MDRELRELLRDCLKESGKGSDPEQLAQRHPHRAEELKPYLKTALALRSRQLATPPAMAQARGRERLLSRLAAEDGGRGKVTFLRHGLIRAGTALAGVLVLAGGVAGASAAAGGPDVASPVIDAVTGINHAPDNAANGKEHANQNAFEGSDNAGQGIQNASENGQTHANPNASEGAGNASQGAGNASENGQEHPTPNPTQGAANAEDGLGTANGHAATPVPHATGAPVH